MSTRTVTGVERDLRGRIMTLYGDREGWSPMSSAEAARLIARGIERFVVESDAGSVPLHAYGARWVRTSRDLTEADNLDNLAAPDTVGLGAGDFGLVVSLSSDGLAALAREMHASGGVADALTAVDGDWLVTGVLGLPRFEPLGEGRSVAVIRDVICHARPAADVEAAGFSAVASVTTHCTVTVRVSARSQLAECRLEYSVPARGAVQVQTPLAPDHVAALRAALSGWLERERRSSWSLPLRGVAANARAVALRFGPTGAAQLGISFTGTRARTFPSPATSWDWTVGLSRPFVVERVAEGLRAQLGGLPPPMGTDHRVRIPGTIDIYLRSLELQLVQGEVLLLGSAVRSRPVEVTARFTIRCRLGVDAAANLTIRVVDADVDVVEWYAKLVDFVTGGALISGLESGIGAAIAGPLVADGAGLIDEALVAGLVSGGSAASATLRAVLRRVWVEPGAVQLGGDFERSPRPPVPVAIRLGGRIDATLTRAPGAELSEVCWVVDGVEDLQRFEDRSLSLSVGSGVARVAMRITTDEGLSATITDVTDTA